MHWTPPKSASVVNKKRQQLPPPRPNLYPDVLEAWNNSLLNLLASLNKCSNVCVHTTIPENPVKSLENL